MYKRIYIFNKKDFKLFKKTEEFKNFKENDIYKTKNHKGQMIYTLYKWEDE